MVGPVTSGIVEPVTSWRVGPVTSWMVGPMTSWMVGSVTSWMVGPVTNKDSPDQLKIKDLIQMSYVEGFELKSIGWEGHSPNKMETCDQREFKTLQMENWICNKHKS